MKKHSYSQIEAMIFKVWEDAQDGTETKLGKEISESLQAQERLSINLKLTAKVWPSTGQPRKWFIQNPDEISLSGSFSYLDEFSTNSDCVHADTACMYRTFEGWRDATDSERDEAIFQLDQDDFEQFQSGDD